MIEEERGITCLGHIHHHFLFLWIDCDHVQHGTPLDRLYDRFGHDHDRSHDRLYG